MPKKAIQNFSKGGVVKDMLMWGWRTSVFDLQLVELSCKGAKYCAVLKQRRRWQGGCGECAEVRVNGLVRGQLSSQEKSDGPKAQHRPASSTSHRTVTLIALMHWRRRCRHWIGKWDSCRAGGCIECEVAGDCGRLEGDIW